MPKWPLSDDDLRAMYAGGRANAAAKWFARLWGAVFASGVFPRRWVALEVPGRRTGNLQRVPVGLADVDGRWYLVSMLGECNWVKNARANGDRVVLRHGAPIECALVEVPPTSRGRILQRYVDVAPGGRPHIPVPRGASVAAFDAVAAGYPVFEVHRVGTDGTTSPLRPPRSWLPLALGGVCLAAAVVAGVRRAFGRGGCTCRVR